MPRTVRAAGVTMPGRKPGPNQDGIVVGTMYVSDGCCEKIGSAPFLLAAADGVSGDPGGEFASAAALFELRISAPAQTAAEAAAAFSRANESIWWYAEKYPAYKTMCTTLAACWVFDASLTICSRGNTAVYLIRSSGMLRLTRPHEDEYGALTSYLGAQRTIGLEGTEQIVVERGLDDLLGTRILLVTDGVTCCIPEDALSRMVMEKRGTVLDDADRIAQAAYDAGSRDNISVVLAELA